MLISGIMVDFFSLMAISTESPCSLTKIQYPRKTLDLKETEVQRNTKMHISKRH